MITKKTNKGMRLFLIFVIIILIPTIWFVFLNKDSDHPDVSKNLAGKWLRSDGPYTLEVKDVLPDGKLSAAYFNPDPIHVEMALWSMKEGALELYVELNDINYKGSNYKLRYNEQTDQLIGFYYQAVAKQTFDVTFNRK